MSDTSFLSDLKDLATDIADTRSVLLHAYEFYKNEFEYETDVIILLQPTSPLRTAIHLKEAMELYDGIIDMVVSVNETKSNPYFVLYEENEEGFLEKSKKSDCTRKQDCPKVWELNGAIYIINVKSLKKKQPKDFEKIVGYEMKPEMSVDVDTELDWKILEAILRDG